MKLDMNDLAGRVAIVGAGPGDPELVTVRAVRLLQEADVVLFDRLACDELLDYCRTEARCIDVGKIPGGRATSQNVINALMVKEARDGQFVVRLKGGDPFVFGRGGEEAIRLADHGIPFEIVPGISSCIAAPQSAGIPVTHRGLSTHFSVVTAVGAGSTEELEERWRKLANAGGTLVFLMGVKRMPRIVEVLGEEGIPADTPAAVVQQGTTPDEVVVEGTLEEIVGLARDADIRPPATLIIGDVVDVRRRSGAGREAVDEADLAHQKISQRIEMNG